jgi:uncharacterized protein YneR
MQSTAGAKQIALSNSDIAKANDVFTLFNNPGGLSQIHNREIGFFYSPSPFGLQELATGYFAYNEPTSFGNFGFGFMNYGFELYKENKFQIAYSNIIATNISFGISVFYRTVTIQNYGNTGIFNISFGGIYNLTKNFSLGFAVQNPLRLSSDNIEQPIQFTFGTSYEIIDETYLSLALQKELDFPFSIHFGIDYPIVEFLSLRFGLQNEPNIYSAGFGINYSYFNLDYAVTSHQDLGFTHQVGIIINFSSSK